MNKMTDLSEANKDEDNNRKHFSIRINMFFFATFLLFTILIVKLALLQFVEGKELQEIEDRNTLKPVTIAPIRGNIYDINEAPIAYTRSSQSLFYQLGMGKKKEEIIKLANDLAAIFAQFSDNQEPLSAADIIKSMDAGYDLNGDKKKIIGRAFSPRRIKGDLSQVEIAYISEHRDELNGISIAEESTRVYDSEKIAVQLVGYLRPYKSLNSIKSGYLDFYKENADMYLPEEYIGLDGLEFMYQSELRGQNGYKKYPVNSEAKIVGPVQLDRPLKGNNLYLTVDKNVQLATQKAIEDHVKYLQTTNLAYYRLGKNAVSGYAVAMEVDTGRVVAMANYPDYDPNDWTGGISTEQYNKVAFSVPNGTIRDRPSNLPGNHASSLVPPGSILKPLSVLVGLNEKLFGPNERYYDTGEFIYGKNKEEINNSDNQFNGWITPAQALQKSSNTFMSEMVGEAMFRRVKDPITVWDNYMKSFGLGVSTNSGLPGEQEGTIYYINDAEKFQAQFPLIKSSFGQEARYTVLQLAQYATMLANKGTRYKPQFVDRITTYEGEVIQKVEKEVLNEISFPKEYWQVLKDGMKSEVSGFEDVSYTFARKTGTSEQEVGGKIVDNAVFIAFAPAENPKIAVAVVVPEGGFGRYGAAPIARKILDAYDQYVGLNGTPKGVGGNSSSALKQ